MIAAASASSVKVLRVMGIGRWPGRVGFPAVLGEMRTRAAGMVLVREVERKPDTDKKRMLRMVGWILQAALAIVGHHNSFEATTFSECENETYFY